MGRLLDGTTVLGCSMAEPKLVLKTGHGNENALEVGLINIAHGPIWMRSCCVCQRVNRQMLPYFRCVQNEAEMPPKQSTLIIIPRQSIYLAEICSRQATPLLYRVIVILPIGKVHPFGLVN